MSKIEQTSQRLRAGHLLDVMDIPGLVEQAADMAVLLNPDGIVDGISTNPESPSLGCLDHWVGRSFLDFLAAESRETFAERTALVRSEPQYEPRPLEINHVDNANWEAPVRYTLHRVGESGALLLLGRDMQPYAEVQKRLVAEQTARERDGQLLRGTETFYRVVLEASETPLVLIEPEPGRIRDINSAAAQLLGSKVDRLRGTSFAQVFEGRRRAELADALQAAAVADEMRGIDTVSRRNGRVLKVLPEYFRAAGTLYMLCRIAPMDDSDGGGPEFAGALATLYADAGDAIVLTDGKGMIREANEAFLVLADAAQLRDLKGESLADFLVRGSVDLKLLIEGATKRGRMRRYAAQLQSVVGTRAPVEISVTRLRQRGGDLGFGFIIRESAARDTAEVTVDAVGVSDEAMRSVMDLVGTASLKELVSATSDVVEKMCIETAVRLTGNNRVAAAEMLGLSRQSLYVKLRKYGLLKSSE
ncbi:MAG: transcriptional regulator PpsR [Roseovarius sp.]